MGTTEQGLPDLGTVVIADFGLTLPAGQWCSMSAARQANTLLQAVHVSAPVEIVCEKQERTMRRQLQSISCYLIQSRHRSVKLYRPERQYMSSSCCTMTVSSPRRPDRRPDAGADTRLANPRGTAGFLAPEAVLGWHAYKLTQRQPQPIIASCDPAAQVNCNPVVCCAAAHCCVVDTAAVHTMTSLCLRLQCVWSGSGVQLACRLGTA